jgi:hypothetical protein
MASTGAPYGLPVLSKLLGLRLKGHRAPRNLPWPEVDDLATTALPSASSGRLRPRPIGRQGLLQASLE